MNHEVLQSIRTLLSSPIFSTVEICEQLSNEKNNAQLLRRAIELLNSYSPISVAAIAVIANLTQTPFNRRTFIQKYPQQVKSLLSICFNDISDPDSENYWFPVLTLQLGRKKKVLSLFYVTVHFKMQRKNVYNYLIKLSWTD